jgi:hypothetical protein
LSALMVGRFLVNVDHPTRVALEENRPNAECLMKVFFKV